MCTVLPPDIDNSFPEILISWVRLGSLFSIAAVLPLIVFNSALVANVASLDFARYLSSALTSVINPATDGISDFLA